MPQLLQDSFSKRHPQLCIIDGASVECAFVPASMDTRCVSSAYTESNGEWWGGGEHGWVTQPRPIM